MSRERDKAIDTIHTLALQHGLAVSVVTVDDVLSAAGVHEDDVTSAHVEAVLGSWEWRHYGDGWADWFTDVELSA